MLVVTTVLAFLFVVGVLVLAHELGHYLMARWCGVRVVTFSVGIGPRLFGIRRGDTDYRVSAIPLGGYVRMAGQQSMPPDVMTGDEFLSKTKWQRALILLAGPAMNLILATALATLVLSPHYNLWLWDAAGLSMQWTALTSLKILDTLGALLSGGLAPNHLLGPLGIAQLAGHSARASLESLLALMALISVNLGVVNMLPVPLLDGGHIAMLAFEGASGRNLTPGARRLATKTGLAFLLLLVVTAFYGDINRLGWI